MNNTRTELLALLEQRLAAAAQRMQARAAEPPLEAWMHYDLAAQVTELPGLPGVKIMPCAWVVADAIYLVGQSWDNWARISTQPPRPQDGLDSTQTPQQVQSDLAFNSVRLRPACGHDGCVTDCRAEWKVVDGLNQRVDPYFRYVPGDDD